MTYVLDIRIYTIRNTRVVSANKTWLCVFQCVVKAYRISVLRYNNINAQVLYFFAEIIIENLLCYSELLHHFKVYFSGGLLLLS